MINDLDLIFTKSASGSTVVAEQGPITATAASTDYIDLLSAKDIGAGQMLVPFVRVAQAFNNLTDLTIAIEGAPDDGTGAPNWGSKKVLCSYKAVLAELSTVNKPVVGLPAIPAGLGSTYRHLRAYFTVNGTAPTTGKLVVGLNRETAKPNNDAVNF